MALRQPPVIGITCVEIRPEADDRPLRIGQNQSYLRAVSRAGGTPLLIPHVGEDGGLRALYERIDGLLLSGGEDMHPARYGQEIHEACRRISLQRDETELRLTLWAMEEARPLLAICRGIQVLNVGLGGTLYQDIQAQIPGASRHDWYPGYARDRRPHTVAITPGSRLAGIVEADLMRVNSLHHQSLRDVASRLAVTARAPDDVIEAVEADDHPFAIGVQWHPEELADDDPRAQHLFDAFVGACRL